MRERSLVQVQVRALWGMGLQRGGHMTCNQEIRRVQIPYPPLRGRVLVTRQSHNLLHTGSNPVLATYSPVGEPGVPVTLSR
jgi:hypothetical protein